MSINQLLDRNSISDKVRKIMIDIAIKEEADLVERLKSGEPMNIRGKSGWHIQSNREKHNPDNYVLSVSDGSFFCDQVANKAVWKYSNILAGLIKHGIEIVEKKASSVKSINDRFDGSSLFILGAAGDLFIDANGEWVFKSSKAVSESQAEAIQELLCKLRVGVDPFDSSKH